MNGFWLPFFFFSAFYNMNHEWIISVEVYRFIQLQAHPTQISNFFVETKKKIVAKNSDAFFCFPILIYIYSTTFDLIGNNINVMAAYILFGSIHALAHQQRFSLISLTMPKICFQHDGGNFLRKVTIISESV